MKKFREEAIVVANQQVARGHHVLTLESLAVAEEALPGQFCLLRSSLPGMPLLSRPFSIYGADVQKCQVEFLIKEVGPATRLICSQPPGSIVLLVGPLGRPFEKPEGEQILLIGGGTGVAPLAFFAQRMAGKVPMHAVIGAPSAEYLLGRERFTDAGVAVALVTEDGSEGEKGMPTEVLAERICVRARHASPLQVSVLSCGPLAMLAEVARICREAGVECQVSLENQLGCGIGACYGCVVPALNEDASPGWARVCADGPVFFAERIDWGRIQTQSSAD